MWYVLGALLLIALLGAVCQKIGVRRMNKEYPAPGRIVQVKPGVSLHVLSSGKGPRAVLFSGWGCAVPVIDFSPLNKELNEQGFRAVTVEKPGYGFAPAVKERRIIDTVVEEIHEALKLAGEEPPYLLIGHSLAGTEILRFATLYPNETSGLISLDAPAPLCYLTLATPPAVMNLMQAALRAIGVRRLQMCIPRCRTSYFKYLNHYQYLDKKLLPLERQMQCANAANRSVRDEIRLLKQNSRVAGDTTPEGIKLVMLIASDTKEKLYEKLQPRQNEYIEKNNAVVYELEGKHNLQHYAPARIAEIAAQEFHKE